MACSPHSASRGVRRRGSDLDTIGVTALEQADPTLTGAGVAVIQAEASLTAGTGAANDTFEINPASAGLPANIFTYINSGGSLATAFPNQVGPESSHADAVAAYLAAVAPGISSLDNYDASYYYDNVIATGERPSSVNPALHNAQIVNQSFIFSRRTSAEVAEIDRAYDSYAAANNVLFISAAGNSVSPPAAAFLGLQRDLRERLFAESVNVRGGRRPLDGRSHCARQRDELFHALCHRARRPSCCRRPARATAAPAPHPRRRHPHAQSPLAQRRRQTGRLVAHRHAAAGPGVWRRHGERLPIVARTEIGTTDGLVLRGANSALQPPPSLLLSSGWDLGSLPGGNTTNHYFFTAPATGAASDTLTATIDWNVTEWDRNDNAIFNSLDLALYDVTTNTPSLVSISDSTIDNLQQLYVTGLVPNDTYDLRVYQASSPVGGGTTYGLAYSVSPASATAVPEPAALALVAVGLCGLLACRLRKSAACRP